MARRAFWLAVLLALALPWLGYRPMREWIRPAAATHADAGGAVPAGTSAPPTAPSLLAAGGAGTDAEAVGGSLDVAAIGRDARAGDGEGAVARLADLGAQVHRQALLADRGSAVRREAGRRDVAAIAGVRAAGWVDRMTLLMVMSGRGAGYGTIAEACRRLAAHGDIAGLAVRVQEVATDDVAAAALIGECRPPGAVAGARQPFPGTSLRAHASADSGPGAEPEDPAAAAERRRREEESLRILSENTPELPSAPQPRATPDAR